MNHDVFITFHNHDIEIAEAVCCALEQSGIKCWMAPRDIPPSANFSNEIFRANEFSKVVVVIFSERASISQWVRTELHIGFDEDKPLFVFRIDQTPFSGIYRVLFHKATIIDTSSDYKAKIKNLVASVFLVVRKEKKSS